MSLRSVKILLCQLSNTGLGLDGSYVCRAAGTTSGRKVLGYAIKCEESQISSGMPLAFGLSKPGFGK